MRIAVCDDERYFRDLITEKINEIYKEDIDCKGDKKIK